MVQVCQFGLNVLVIGGNGMNLVKVFDLVKDKFDNLWVGSLWLIENYMVENSKFIIVYIVKYKVVLDQFVVQVYDVMYIVSKVLKMVKFSGNFEVDCKVICDVLLVVKYIGVMGVFVFCQVMVCGKLVGYDVVQMLIVSVIKNGKYIIEK